MRSIAVLVRDRMSTPAVTVRADSDYKVALRLMQDCALHHLPVVDDRGRVVGIAAERDLLIAATHYLQSAIEVGEVMHPDVVTAMPETPVGEAAILMLRHKIGGLPVVDADGYLHGIITETDIFKAFVEMLANAEETARRFSNERDLRGVRSAR